MRIIILALSFFSLSATATASVDWTKYLKPMTDGCQSPSIHIEDIPNYKNLITHTDFREEQRGSAIDTREEIKTYFLKNATAWGYPLEKIEYLQGYEWKYFTIYFKNDGFMSLRPKFKLPATDRMDSYDYYIIKNDKFGYKIEDVGTWNLEFDLSNKSILCGGGL